MTERGGAGGLGGLQRRLRWAGAIAGLLCATVVLSGPAAAPAAGHSPTDERPNIVVIVADDLGYGDISFDGNQRIQTPNIDSLARQGARFEYAYAGDAICAPSRAALMTGRNPQRFGFEYLLDATATLQAAGLGSLAVSGPGLVVRRPVPPELNGLPKTEITLADLLRRQGYHTGAVGKWDLGAAPNLMPSSRGFDETADIRGGASLYAPLDDPDVVSAALPWNAADGILRSLLGRTAKADGVRRGRYLTDALAQDAVGFIGRNKHRPFFLYLAFTAPHTPLQAPKRIYDQLGYISDPRIRTYYAMVKSLDDGVGRVLAELKAAGLDRNTFIIFTSDNGAAPYVRVPGANGPFRGWKTTYFEGGLRVPFFVRWPARIPPGMVVPGGASSLDLAPTFMALSGGRLPDDRPYDGRSLLPALTRAAPNDLVDRSLYWRKEEYRAIRYGFWKLQTTVYPGKTWLYDLSNDPTEQVNLAARRPDKVRDLAELFAQREKSYLTPLWPAQSRARVDIDGFIPDAGADVEHIFWAN